MSMDIDLKIELSNNPIKHFLLSNIAVNLYEGICLPSFIRTKQSIKPIINNNLYLFKLNIPTISLSNDFLLDIVIEWQNHPILRIIQTFALDNNGNLFMKNWFPTNQDNRTVSDSDFVMPSLLHLTHPLLSSPLIITESTPYVLKANIEFLDITSYWKERYKKNEHYEIMFNLKKGIEGIVKRTDIYFRVFAYLSGTPFIWFACIPDRLLSKSEIYPLVFFRPRGQTTPDYKPNALEGIDNVEHENKSFGIFRYMVKPIYDDEITPTVLNNLGGLKGISSYRAVFKLDNKTATPNPFAGLEDALYKSEKDAILFFPLKHANPAHSYRDAISPKLPELLKTQMLLCWSNSFISRKLPSVNIKHKEMVISCYSDSGITMWQTIRNNINNIKGIILVEPQDVVKPSPHNPAPNRIGNKEINNFLNSNENKNVKVIFIGRYKNANYNLRISNPKVVYLPYSANYQTIWNYLPDTSKNFWFQYQSLRLLPNVIDPYMDTEERTHLIKITKMIKSINPSISTYLRNVIKQASTITNNKSNEDGWDEQHGYCHNFALCGGQIFKKLSVNSTTNYWDLKEKVEYKTFFQEALELIG